MSTLCLSPLVSNGRGPGAMSLVNETAHARLGALMKPTIAAVVKGLALAALTPRAPCAGR